MKQCRRSLALRPASSRSLTFCRFFAAMVNAATTWQGFGWKKCRSFLLKSSVFFQNPVVFENHVYYFNIFHCFIELDDGKIYRKPLYLMVNTMVSCRFSLKPIHWILGVFFHQNPMVRQTVCFPNLTAILIYFGYTTRCQRNQIKSPGTNKIEKN